MRSHRKFALGAAVLSLAIVAAACSSGGGGKTNTGSSASPAQNKGTIIVGTSDVFAENQIVAEMYAQVLEKNGYSVKQINERTMNVERAQAAAHAPSSICDRRNRNRGSTSTPSGAVSEP